MLSLLKTKSRTPQQACRGAAGEHLAVGEAEAGELGHQRHDVANGIDHCLLVEGAVAEHVALVDGRLPAAAGRIELLLAADWPRRPLRIIDPVHGKPSVTLWRILQPADGDFAGASRSTRVELEPVTGRSHQLRVHLQALGHPIVGDALYAPAQVLALSPRLLLHACRLELPHPADGTVRVFTSPAPF